MTKKASSRLTKVTVLLSPESFDALMSAARMKGLNRTDALNRALQTYEFMLNAQAKGRKILFEDPCGCLSEVTDL